MTTDKKISENHLKVTYILQNTKQKNYGARLRSPGYDGILAGQYVISHRR